MPPRKAKFNNIEQYQKVMEKHFSEQLHAGRRPDGEAVYHTNSNGNYWSGWMPHDISPEVLFTVCVTTIVDLMHNHPELAARLGELLTQRAE